MRIRRYEFRPSRTLLIVAAIALPIFIGAGFWQIERGAQRRALEREIMTRETQPPIALGAPLADLDAARFRRTELHGVFESQHGFLVDNAVLFGEAGYCVVTPLRLSGSELRVLVNRGWIAAGSSREILPRVDTPGEEVTVTGVVELPLKPRFTLEDEPIAGGAWPPVWNYLDYERFRRAVPHPVQPVVVLQDADNPFGYARQWSKKNFFRYKSYINVGYAVQWFSFAVMLIVYVAIKSTRRVATAESAVEQPKAQPLAHR